jgi:hypothetical protein
VGGVAIVAVFAGVIYFSRESAEPVAAAKPAEEQRVPAETAAPESVAPLPMSRSEASARPVPTDPRLAALMVSPDNGLIEFVVGPNGNVIKEIDKDPTSPGFRKPLREYTYAGDRVVGLTSYKYLGGQVQIIKTVVSYKPDGSVDQYRESTNYDFEKNGKGKS